MSTTELRFWAKVELSDSCWNWTGAKHRGYGQFTLRWWRTADGRWQCQTVRAHRLAYEWLVGLIPDGLTIDHECENRSCVRPGIGHCVVRTTRENTLRGNTVSGINSRKTHCIRGHEFTEDNIIRRPSKPNGRECRSCANEQRRRRYAERVSSDE